MRRLRDPDTGCPWDVQQDFASIAPYTIEEAYEVADAIERSDMDDLRGELGDLIRFLDRIRRDGREILRRVPFAPGLRIAQACHDGEESVGLLGHEQDLPPRGSNRKGYPSRIHGVNASAIIHIMLNKGRSSGPDR